MFFSEFYFIWGTTTFLVHDILTQYFLTSRILPVFLLLRPCHHLLPKISWANFAISLIPLILIGLNYAIYPLNCCPVVILKAHLEKGRDISYLLALWENTKYADLCPWGTFHERQKRHRSRCQEQEAKRVLFHLHSEGWIIVNMARLLTPKISYSCDALPPTMLQTPKGP